MSTRSNVTHLDRIGQWVAVFALIVVPQRSGAQAVTSERDALGNLLAATDRDNLPKPKTPKSAESIERWNGIAIDASGLDHTPVRPGETRTFGEQLGPARASRAMAIVHIAMFDALNAIEGGYRGYTALSPVTEKKIASSASIATAAHDTLVALFPSQAPSFDAALQDDLDAIKTPEERARGVALGRQAAAAILALRAGDGSEHREPRLGVDYLPGSEPGAWRQDPISQIPIALGAHWYTVKPFVIPGAEQFRAPPPPALTSAAYAAAFEEVKRLGGNGAPGGTATQRTTEQTRIGLYWAYDGTPSLCAPPRLYNQITMMIARQQKTRNLELARLLALINVAMADAAMAIWESKYHYGLWRPIGGIREADPGTGPSGLGDGNPSTVGDADFIPLGAPASNLLGPNFTPPFPAYPSGHAGFGGALFQTLRTFYHRDDISFTFVSDEFNGETRGNDGTVRPLLPRTFRSFSEAEEENGQSRIYLGIHWSFDKTEGIAQGRRVADYVFANAFTPLNNGK